MNMLARCRLKSSRFCEKPFEVSRKRIVHAKRKSTPYLLEYFPNVFHRLWLERKVTNWDTGYLKTAIQDVIRATGYAHYLDISFPVLHYQVILQDRSESYTVESPKEEHGKSLKACLNKCFHRERPKVQKHEITYWPALRTIWPYASGPPEDWERKAVKECERSWLKKWTGVIQSAVNNRRQTWLTDRHYLSYKAGKRV